MTVNNIFLSTPDQSGPSGPGVYLESTNSVWNDTPYYSIKEGTLDRGIIKKRNFLDIGNTSIVGSENCHVFAPKYISLRLLNCTDVEILGLNLEESKDFFEGTRLRSKEYLSLLRRTIKTGKKNLFITFHPLAAKEFKHVEPIIRLNGKCNSNYYKIILDDLSGLTLVMSGGKEYEYFLDDTIIRKKGILI